MTWITFLDRQQLKHKLALNLTTLLLIMLGIGGIGLYSQRILSDKLVSLYDDGLLGLSSAKTAHIQYAVIGRAIRQAIMAPDAGQQQLAIKQLSEARQRLGQETSALRAGLAHTGTQNDIERFDQAYALYDRDIELAFSLIRESRIDEARTIIISPEFQIKGINSYNALTSVTAAKETRAKTLVNDAIDVVRSSQFNFLGLLGAGLLFGLIAGVIIANSIRRPSERLRQAVSDLARGQLDMVVPYTDYTNEIGKMANAISVLQIESRQMANQRWIKTHQAEIQARLPAATSFTGLAQDFLRRVAPLLNIDHGLFYVFDDNRQQLQLVGGYGHAERKHLEQVFSVGEGWVGQCAQEREPITITPSSSGTLPENANPFGTPVRFIALLPVLSGQRLMGVIEFASASTDAFKPEEQALLDALMPALAMSLDILARR